MSVAARTRLVSVSTWIIDNVAATSIAILGGTDNLNTIGSAAVRWLGIAVSTTQGIAWYAASAAANPVVQISTATAGLQFGAGGGTALDTALRWAAANTLEMLATTFRPAADNALAVGTTALRFANFIGVQFNVYTAAADANASASVTAGTLRLGVGGATALDTRITRSAAATLTVDNGAGAAVNVYPGADNVGQIGDGTHRWALLRGTTVTSGDHCYDDTTCAFCGRPFAVGERLTPGVIAIEPDLDSDGNPIFFPSGAPRMLTRTVPVHLTCEA